MYLSRSCLENNIYNFNPMKVNMVLWGSNVETIIQIQKKSYPGSYIWSVFRRYLKGWK